MKDRYKCNYLGIDSFSFQNTRRVDFETWQNLRLEHILILSSNDLIAIFSTFLSKICTKNPWVKEQIRTQSFTKRNTRNREIVKLNWRWMDLTFVHMKEHVPFQGQIIEEYKKYTIYLHLKISNSRWETFKV